MTLSSPSKVTYTTDRFNLSPVTGVKNHKKKFKSPQPPALNMKQKMQDLSQDASQHHTT
jgi:hypothetical protein